MAKQKINATRIRTPKAYKALICAISSILVLALVQVPNNYEITSSFSEAENSSSLTTKTREELVDKYTFPNVLIIGVQKGGTTALANWLFQKGVCQARNFAHRKLTKEVHHFDKTDEFENGVMDYARFFEHCNSNNHQQNRSEQIFASSSLISDATPEYLHYPSSIHSFFVQHSNPNKLKIILSMLEPTSRELSLYNHKVHDVYLRSFTATTCLTTTITKQANITDDGDNGDDKPTRKVKSFVEFVDTFLLQGLQKDGCYDLNDRKYPDCGILRKDGYYAIHLKEWFQLFPPNQILLLSYDEIESHPDRLLMRLTKFLLNYKEDDALEVDFGKLDERNSQKNDHRIKKMSCTSQDKLQQIFDPWNEELYELLEESKYAMGNPPSVEQQPFPKFQLKPCRKKQTK